MPRRSPTIDVSSLQAAPSGGKGIEHGLSFHHEETGIEEALAAEDPVTFRLGHRRTTIHCEIDMCKVCALNDRSVPYMYHDEEHSCTLKSACEHNEDIAEM